MVTMIAMTNNTLNTTSMAGNPFKAFNISMFSSLTFYRVRSSYLILNKEKDWFLMDVFNITTGHYQFCQEQGMHVLRDFPL